jgi:hypothetical protein
MLNDEENSTDLSQFNLGDWAVDVEFVEWILKSIPKNSTIIECGSGTGTTAVLCEPYELYSIENNPHWQDKFNSTYIKAPLINDLWYDPNIVRDSLPDKYDLIVIDGPVGHRRKSFINNYHLFDENVPILLDDSQRAPEQELIKILTEQYGKKVEFTFTGKSNKSFTLLTQDILPVMNILMRTSGRPNGFKRMYDNIKSQTYGNINLIVGVDDDASKEYVLNEGIPDSNIIQFDRPERENTQHMPYNLYFNDMVRMCKPGWIWFVDDDDIIPSDTTVETIMKNCRHKNYVYLFKTDVDYINKTIPSTSFGKDIVIGDVATPCIVHHTHLSSNAIWEDRRCGDFNYLTKFKESIGIKRFKWIDEIIYRVEAANLGNRTDIKG